MRFHSRLNTLAVIAGTEEKKKKQNRPRGKMKIQLLKERDGFSWIFFIGQTARASCPQPYKRLVDASRSARTFRELLTNSDEVEILSPEGHIYSGAN